MIRSGWLIVCFTLLVLMPCIGCGGSSSQTTTTPPTPPPTAQSYYAYIDAFNLNNNSESLTTYSVSEASGQLTPVGNPISQNVNCGLIVSSNNKFLYAESCASGLIQPYSIDPSSGKLTAVGSGTTVNIPVPSNGKISTLVLAPNGKFAYVINENPIGLNGQYGPLNLVIYSIGSDGSLTAVGTPMPLDEYYGCCSLIAIAPKGDFLYLASDYVFVYAVDANTGALTEVAGSPFVPNPDPTFPAHDPTSPMALAVAPSGNYLYAHDAMYSVAPGTGVLTTMNFFYHNLSNLAENGGPMVLNSTGTDAYMQGVDEGWVASFSVNTATGELTPTGNVQGQYSDLSYGNNSGSKSPSIAVDPTGAYLYALWDTGWSSNGQFTGPGEVSIYSLNSSSRLLAYIGVVAGTSGTKPYAIAFATE